MLLEEDMMSLRPYLFLKEMVVLAGQNNVKARPARKDEFSYEEAGDSTS